MSIEDADRHEAEGERIMSTAIALAEGGNVPGELLLATPEQRALMARELAAIAGVCFGAARYHVVRAGHDAYYGRPSRTAAPDII